MEVIFDWVQEPLFLILVGSGLLLILLRPFTKSLKQWQRARQSKNWPQVEGQVEKCRLKTKKGEGHNQGQTEYALDLYYSYEIEGEQYFSDSRFLTSEYYSSDPGDREEFIRDHPAGSRLKVFYDPDRKEDSLLLPGLRAIYWYAPLIYLVFMLFALLLLGLGLR